MSVAYKRRADFDQSLILYYKIEMKQETSLFSHYPVLLFDLDGTLSDPMLGITHSVQYALSKYGIQVDDLQTLCPFIGPPLQDSFRDFYHFTPEQADEACMYYHEFFVEKGMFENELYAGIPELLNRLKDSDKKLFVATSKPEPLARQILAYFKIDGYFDFIGGDTLERTRSAKADVIRYVIEQNALTDLGQLLMIGDRKHDIIGAKAVGIASIGVLYGYGDRPEMEQAGADCIVATIEELEKVIL